jgi:hypothetical protein
MEIYIKNSKGQLEETTLYQVLKNAFGSAGFKMENGSFSGENHRWIGIVQESKKPSEVVTNITFNDKGDTITGVRVYETPIMRVVDSDHSRQVV